MTIIVPVITKRSGFDLLQEWFSSDSDSEDVLADEPLDGEAYHYWYAPENSMGVNETKTVNWSYFKELFLAHIDWILEYKRYEHSEWTDGIQYLTINRTWNDLGFWKFNLILDVPVHVYSARFTFGCNLSVLQYVEREGYEVWINYTANATEVYSVMFNWSDIANIPNLVITKGVQDGMFWFRFMRDNIPVGHYEFDPWFGIQQTAGAFTTINDYMKGTRYEMGTIDGIADSMTAYTRLSFGGAGSTYKLKMAIYDLSANLIGETDETTVTGNKATWNTAPFSAPKPELSANTWYYLVVISDTAFAEVGWFGGIETRGREDVIAYEDAFEDPATWDTNTNTYGIYCTYTEIEDIVIPLHPSILLLPFMLFVLLLGGIHK